MAPESQLKSTSSIKANRNVNKTNAAEMVMPELSAAVSKLTKDVKIP